MDRHLVLALLAFLARFPDLYFQAYADNRPYTTGQSARALDELPVAAGYKAMYRKMHRVSPDLSAAVAAGQLQVDKFFIAAPDPRYFTEIRACADRLAGRRCLMPLDFGMEVIPIAVDKGLAVARLCQELRIDLADTLVIGDSENDLGMLDVGGISVAMGNAPAHVRSHADWIAPSNEQHGAAAAIRRFVLSPAPIARTIPAIPENAL